ncbi:hypothetical protein [Salinibacter altiplanensis]|uniref:hypothetical protein n=2 Tax=Salinibacter altiplanensis TaxID=1803181 RepID=UPI00131A0FD4|nr:hypothetical protein [Salinibacter altiplanensis]
MYTLRRRLLLFLCVVGLGLPLSGCDQGEGMDEALPPEEAETRISSAVEGLSESAGTLEGGEFSNSLKGFLGLENGEATSEDWAEPLIERLDAVIKTSDERFQFDASTGVYVWSADTEEWVREGSSNSIVLEFPATEGAAGNNTMLELSRYSDTPLTVNGETVYLPTSGAGAISVDESEVFSVDLNGVDYATEEGFEVPIPQSFSLEIFTAPHTHTFNLSENSSTDYDFSFDLENRDQLVAGFSVGAQLATDNYDELESTDVEELSGELRIGPDLTVPYTVEAGEIAAFDDPTEEQVNNRIDATVQFQGQELATLQYDDGSERFEVVYSDGSVDPASMFFEDFVSEMEAIWSEYLGRDDFGTVLDDIVLD